MSHSARSRVTVAAVGTAGVGKTMLAAAITKVLAGQDGRTRYISPGELAAAVPRPGERVCFGTPGVVEYHTAARRYSHVDLPDAMLVRQMVAGQVRVDGALLTVGAVDGVTPATRQRAGLARRLGVSHVVVTLTKADLLDDSDRLESAERDVRDMLTDLGYQGSLVPVVPTAAVRALDGDPAWPSRISELLNAMDRYLPVPPPQHAGPLLMPVETVIDAVVAAGGGPVPTGTIEQGVLQVGDPVEIVGVSQAPTPAVCAGIATPHGRVDHATPGDQVAVMLDCPRSHPLRPGQIITAPGTGPPPRRRCTGLIHLLYLAPGETAQPADIGGRRVLTIRHTAVIGQIHLDTADPFAPADIASVEVELDVPMPIQAGLRITIQDSAHTIGIGTITQVQD